MPSKNRWRRAFFILLYIDYLRGIFWIEGIIILETITGTAVIFIEEYPSKRLPACRSVVWRFPLNILQIPDVSYLIIVGGFLLSILALFAPGTGVIEIAAISAILLGGYGVVTIPINLWALIILLVGVIPFVLAVRQSHRLGFLIVSILALAIGSSYIYQGTAWYMPGVSPLLAVVISILAGGFMWVVARKGLEALLIKPRNKLDELVGATGEAQTEINRVDGSAYVAGENWSARSMKPIPVNARVKVVKREGFTLEVEEIPAAVPASTSETPVNAASSGNASSV